MNKYDIEVKCKRCGENSTAEGNILAIPHWEDSIEVYERTTNAFLGKIRINEKICSSGQYISIRLKPSASCIVSMKRERFDTSCTVEIIQFEAERIFYRNGEKKDVLLVDDDKWFKLVENNRLSLSLYSYNYDS